MVSTKAELGKLLSIVRLASDSRGLSDYISSDSKQGRCNDP
jgi:hypothetical protein